MNLHRKIRSWLNPRSYVSQKELRFRRELRGRIVTGAANVRIGRGCVIDHAVEIGSGSTLEDQVRLIGNVKLGKDVYINCFVMISGDVTIADGVLISQFVTMWGRAHRFMNRDLPIWAQHGTPGIDDNGYDTQPIEIGKGAWVGPQVTIFRGIKIGEGAVIGAGSIVTHDVPPYAVAYGAPAKVIKYRESKTKTK